MIADYALWMLAGWVLSALIAGWSGYRWGLHSQIAAKKLEVKTAMLPMIEQFIIRAIGLSTWLRHRDRWLLHCLPTIFS
jgi:hypothetical protein